MKSRKDILKITNKISMQKRKLRRDKKAGEYEAERIGKTKSLFINIAQVG